MSVEYRVITLKPNTQPAREKLLDDMGRDNWRLVCIAEQGDYVFMRERPKFGPLETKEYRYGP